MNIHVTPRMMRHWGLFGIAWLAAAPLCADGLLPPLTDAQIRQAKKALADFKSNPKGPYFQIRWFCNDGSVHPPAPPPCAARGGGFQHAELSATARHLAEWNLDLDTVLAGHTFDEFLDAKRDYHHLKELVLERYLSEVDDGWIYRKARYYRGARQVEDEEKAGRKLLAQLLANPEWLRRNYFLAGQIIAAVPHGAADRTVDRIRSLAKVVADRDSRFGTIRSKIHSLPGADDQKAVEDFLNTRNPEEPERGQLTELAALLKQQYTSRTLAVQLPAFQKKLAGSPLTPALTALAAALESKNAERAFAAGAALSFQVRQQAVAGSDGRRNLDLLDLAALVLENAFQNEAGRVIENPTRRRLLANLLDHYRYAVGAGLLSFREFDALQPELAALSGAGQVSSESYYQSIRYLARSTEWCHATVLKDFGPVAGLYDDVPPAAAGLVDHLVRGSPALPLSNRLEGLIADANRATGIRRSILGQPSSRGIVGLNPGVALGRLGIIDAG